MRTKRYRRKPGKELAALRVLAQYSKHCSLIPDNLWSSAVEMAREHGPNRKASSVRLNYYALKKRLASAGGPPCEGPPARAAFPEPLPLKASGPSVCNIETENPQGGR